MKSTEIKMFGHPALLVCDGKCEKAWGVNGRKDGLIAQLSEDPDDIVYLADHETGIAPQNPGSYEGGEGKPSATACHNKWCGRECERSSIIWPGEEISCPDLSARFYNQPSKHPGAQNQIITIGEIFRPQ